MSFRGAFTREGASNENLQYDDAAAYHFYLTILLLVTVPLLYSILKSVLNPFGHIPNLKDIESLNMFRDRIKKFKKEYKFNYVTKGFIFKVVLACVLCFAIFHSYKVLQETGSQMRGFDPYQILEVQPDASIQKIKKSYRKLALKYHPDRNNNDPQASARFIMISKAYQCLTNQAAKENCLKFGNPEGSTAFNVGIALPSFLIRKQNHVAIMGVVFLLVVIVIPICVIYYQSEMNKYDDHGMLLMNHANIHSLLHQHFSIKDCIKTLPMCVEFKGFKMSRQKEVAYEQLMKKCSEDIRAVILKKKFVGFVNKGMLIIDARLAEEEIPRELEEDERIILKKVPTLVRAMVMIALQRSTEEFKYMYQNQKVVGTDGILSIIWFGQYFLQGLSLESHSFEQLCLLPDQVDKVYKKKKQRKITNLKDLLQSSQERQFLYSLLSPERKGAVEQRLNYFPTVSMEVIVHTAGDKQITAEDIMECIITLKANRKSSFCSAYNYPFLKIEGWYLIVSDGSTVLYLQHINFEKTDFEVKFNRRPHGQAGSHALQVRLVSDCYIGLDIEREVKYEIRPARKDIQEEQQKDSNSNEEEDGSLFSRWMGSMMPKQEQELSDKEDDKEA